METAAGLEKALLKGYLHAQREHALSAVEGLDDQGIRRAMLPSQWSFGGMIRHLTWDEEKFWFRAIVAGDESVIAEFAGPWQESPETGSSDFWTVPEGLTAAEIVATYRESIERSNAIIDATDLDAEPLWWPGDLFGEWRIDSLRQIMLHMMTEVAAHAGHLDAARELVDGKQWLVLTD